MDEPITPGATEAGSEPTVELKLEEPTDVIIQIISFIATVAVLFVAWSLRVQKRAKQKRQKPKKRETLPGPADKAHVESLVRKCSDAADDLVPELLAGLAASPLLVAAAKVSCLAARTSKQLRAELAGCVAGWSELDSMSLPPPVQQNLLLILHQLYQHKVPESVLRLSDAELEQRDEVAALAGQLLLSAFEAACTQQRLRSGVALARLIACNSSGVWSWEEAECVQLCRDTRPGLPHPRISVEASVKSWMGAPHLAPGSTMELSITVHRQHAGPSDAPYERLAWRGHDTVTHAPPTHAPPTNALPGPAPARSAASHAHVHRTHHTPHTTHHTLQTTPPPTTHHRPPHPTPPPTAHCPHTPHHAPGACHGVVHVPALARGGRLGRRQGLAGGASRGGGGGRAAARGDGHDEDVRAQGAW